MQIRKIIQTDKMFRTIKIRLERTNDLFQTVVMFNQACQRVLDCGYENKECNKTRLHRASYKEIRADLPSLPSALVQTARDQASEMLKRDRFKHKIKKKLFSSIRYDKRTLSVFLESGYLTISTMFGRAKYEFILPQSYRQYQMWKVQNAQLIVGREACFLNIQVEGDPPPFNGGDRRLGVDLGINNLAVCSDNSFFNSKHLKKVKGKYQHLKAELQSKGTRSAHRKLKEISGRERRFVNDLNHQVAKEIVNKPYDIFVFEDLSAMRVIKKDKEFNRKLGNWSFHQLPTFVEYKAEALGKRVMIIAPHYTSQTCSQCAHVSRSNRKGREFTCIQCGFSLDADLNAARNIAIFSMREDGRLSVSQPNVACHEVEARKRIETEPSYRSRSKKADDFNRGMNCSISDIPAKDIWHRSSCFQSDKIDGEVHGLHRKIAKVWKSNSESSISLEQVLRNRVALDSTQHLAQHIRQFGVL